MALRINRRQKRRSNVLLSNTTGLRHYTENGADIQLTWFMVLIFVVEVFADSLGLSRRGRQGHCQKPFSSRQHEISRKPTKNLERSTIVRASFGSPLTEECCEIYFRETLGAMGHQ